MPPIEIAKEWSEEIDRRIVTSEIRIKLWIIGGILANLLVAMGGAIPITYNLGKMTQSFDMTVDKLIESNTRVDGLEDWAVDQGYRPKRRKQT